MGKVQNQHGFTAIEALLIILVLAVIGFGGYYVWHSQHKITSTGSTASSATTQTVTPADTILTRTKYIDTFDAGQTSKTMKDMYATLNTKGYVSDAFLSKLNTFAPDYDGLQCTAAGIIPKQTYVPPIIGGDNVTANNSKSETFNNPNGGNSTLKVTYQWQLSDGVWELNGVTCPN